MKKILPNFILWVWCFPQSFFGFLFYLYFIKGVLAEKEYKNIFVYCIDTKTFGGVSLGKFIFVSKKNFNGWGIKHEYGHTIQNYIFGPFYLIIIAIPSAIQFWISKYNKKFRKNYFNRFPEDWADRLAGIKR